MTLWAYRDISYKFHKNTIRDKHVEINHRMHGMNDELYGVLQVTSALLGMDTHEVIKFIRVLNKGLGPEALSIFVVKGLGRVVWTSGPRYIHGDQIRRQWDCLTQKRAGLAIPKWAARQPICSKHHLTQGTPTYMRHNPSYTCEQT